MGIRAIRVKRVVGGLCLLGMVTGLPGVAMAKGGNACAGLPSHASLTAQLSAVVGAGGNAGLGNNMWATVVNRDGTVCAVTRSGALGDQWPGSRVISAQNCLLYTSDAADDLLQV